MHRYALRDDQWERIKDFLPGRKGHVGGTPADNRLFVDAVIYRYRTGIPWRDLPERYGQWKPTHRRYRRWCKSWVFARIFETLAADADNECGFRRMRTVIPIDCGQRFRSIADSVPVIADSGSRRRLQGLTQRCRCQAFHANPPVDTSSRPILWFDRHHPSAPTRTRLVPARTVAVKDGPSSGHRVSGAQRP